jgi:hypothetical protein
MEQKDTLFIENKTSRSIDNCRSVFQVIAWLILLGGVIVTLIGAPDAVEGYDCSLLLIGIGIIISSIPIFIAELILRGFVTIVETSEYKKSLIQNKYHVIELIRTN